MLSSEALHFYVYVLAAKRDADLIRELFEPGFFRERGADYRPIDRAAKRVSKIIATDASLSYVVTAAVSGLETYPVPSSKGQDKFRENKLGKMSHRKIARKHEIEVEAVRKQISRYTDYLNTMMDLADELHQHAHQINELSQKHLEPAKKK
jgi:hypothetical protein